LENELRASVMILMLVAMAGCTGHDAQTPVAPVPTTVIDGAPDDPLGAPSNASHPLINEVELDPRGPDLDRQSIEIYNPHDAVQLDGWRLAFRYNATPTDGRMPLSSWAVPAGLRLPRLGILELELHANQTLPLSNVTIRLVDPDGYIRDTTPPLSDDADDARTWQRYPDGYDTDRGTDWLLRPGTLSSRNQP
jgi:hypothetical protein